MYGRWDYGGHDNIQAVKWPPFDTTSIVFLTIYGPTIDTTTVSHRSCDADSMLRAHSSKRKHCKRTT